MNFLRLILLFLQASSPSLVSKTELPYPPLAKAARIEGVARVSVTVAPDGHIVQASVVSGSNPLLIPGLLDGVRQWRFETTESGGTAVLDVPFSLSADSTKAGGGVITGTLRNPSGQPIANVSVNASRLIYLLGRRRLNVIASATTDDRGVYRIPFLPPDDYIVYASYRGPAGLIPGFNDDFASETYYPGSTALERAGQIIVERDKEAAGIDFSIARSNHVKISGKIVREGNGPPLRPLASPTIYSVPHTDDGMDFAAGLQNVPISNPELTFELGHVEPGRLDLIAVLRDQNESYQGRITVDARSDVRDVVIPVSRGAAITGVVTTDVKDIDLSRLRVSYDSQENLVPAVPGSSGFSAINEKGTFQFLNIPTGTYSISSIVGLPPDAYVSSISLGEKNQVRGNFRVAGGTTQEMQIRIASPGSEIQGMAVDAAGRGVPNGFVTLVPVGDDRSNFFSYRRAKTDTSGIFRLRGVAPGEYRIYAWRNDPASGDTNPGFLSNYEGRSGAVKVELAEKISNVRVTVNEVR